MTARRRATPPRGRCRASARSTPRPTSVPWRDRRRGAVRTARSPAPATPDALPRASFPGGRPVWPARSFVSAMRWPNAPISPSSSSSVWRSSASIIAVARLNASTVTSWRNDPMSTPSTDRVASPSAALTSSTNDETTVSRVLVARADDSGGGVRRWDPSPDRRYHRGVTQTTGPVSIPELGRRAKAASRQLATSSTAVRNDALLGARPTCSRPGRPRSSRPTLSTSAGPRPPASRRVWSTDCG